MNEIKPKILFNIYSDSFGTGYAGNVWDKNSICNSLMTMQGGNRQPLILVNDDEKDSKSLEWNRGNEK